MIMWRFKKAFLASLCLSILASLVTVPVVKTHAQGTDPSGSAADKRWLAVAPGRVEPVSGLIKIAGPVAGVVDSVLVKANETVFAGQPLIRLRDQEARAQLASVAAQVARNKESAASGASARCKAQDAVADAEAAVLEVQSLVDKGVADRRAEARAGVPRAADRRTSQDRCRCAAAGGLFTVAPT
jgi:HlyD family secretion protein